MTLPTTTRLRLRQSSGKYGTFTPARSSRLHRKSQSLVASTPLDSCSQDCILLREKRLMASLDFSIISSASILKLAQELKNLCTTGHQTPLIHYVTTPWK